MGEKSPGTFPSQTLRTLYTDAERSLHAYQNVLVSIESVEPTLDTIERLNKAVQAAARLHPKGVGFLVVIHSDAKPPNDEARDQIKKALPVMGSNMKGVAYVMQGEGFLASAKRSVLTLIMTTARFSFPFKVFSGVHEASTWLFRTMADAAPRTGALEFAAMVDEVVREQFGKISR